MPKFVVTAKLTKKPCGKEIHPHEQDHNSWVPLQVGWKFSAESLYAMVATTSLSGEPPVTQTLTSNSSPSLMSRFFTATHRFPPFSTSFLPVFFLPLFNRNCISKSPSLDTHTFFACVCCVGPGVGAGAVSSGIPHSQYLPTASCFAESPNSLTTWYMTSANSSPPRVFFSSMPL